MSFLSVARGRLGPSADQLDVQCCSAAADEQEGPALCIRPRAEAARGYFSSNAVMSSLAALLFCAAVHSASAVQPNIIVVVADDLSRTLCTFLPEGEGKSLMPTLDRLATEGVVLENMHSPSPVCTPSRYAILTGKFPSRARGRRFLGQWKKDGQTMVGFNTDIVPGETTLPQLMQQAGYVTGAVGKNHAIEVDGIERLPYTIELDDPRVAPALAKNATLLKVAFQSSGFDYAERLYFGNPDADGIKPLAAHNQEWITEGALDFIEQSAADEKPFFLYMATTIPHGPFAPERSWRNAASVTPEGLLDGIPDVQAPRDTIDARLKAAGITGWNTGQVLWLDDAMTAIVNKLEGAGVAQNTVIVFVSDHGTEAKGGAYVAGTRTAAFIWRKGGFPVGTVTQAQLQLPDLAPTLLDLAGGDYRGKKLDGKSFTALLADKADSVHDSLYFEMGYGRAVMKDGFKYLALRYPEYAENMPLEKRRKRLEENTAELAARGRPIPTTDPMAPFSHLFLIPGGHDVDQVAIKGYPSFSDRDQLYDLNTDPGEQNNLAQNPEYAAKLTELREELDRYVRKLPGTFGEFGQ